MSILGAVIRTRVDDLATVSARLAGLPGVELPLDPGDGRLVAVIEDAQVEDRPVSAAATLAQIAGWPEVLGTSLVYEYSGPDSPAPEGSDAIDYRAWRASLADTPTVAPNRPAP